MPYRKMNPSRWAWVSPWLILVSVCVLAGILLILAVKNIHREKEFMVQTLLSQATVLMRSVEAGSRTGMMGMGWGHRQTQMLLEETAQQPDVIYVALVSSAGRVVAHSDPEQVGKVLSVAFPDAGKSVYAFSEGSVKSFDVIKSYQPWHRQRAGRGGEMCDNFPQAYGQKDLFIMVGLDPTPFEDASRQDMHQTIVLFVVMFLVGAAGLLSLIWAQYYRSARCSLEDIRAFTSTLVNQMPIGLMATDLQGVIQKSNDAARVILKQEKGIEGNIQDFPCFTAIARQLQKKRSVVGQETHCRTAAGDSVPLLVNASLIHDGEGKAAGYVFLFADMTDIKILEEQLRRSERLAGLGRLAAGIAHEIRNPLSSIKGFATILAGRFKEDEGTRKLAEVMVREVERLNRVVSELLDFAKPTELNRKPVLLGELIRNSLRLIEREAALQGVEISATVKPEDFLIPVDPDRMTQVLLNLYLNAFQAMDGGGSLRVSAARENGGAVLTVVDTGAGIPSEHLAHIFDPYFTTKPGGVGLGLANVHKFVEAHGGEIEVESAPGQGTSFTIRIPAELPCGEEGPRNEADTERGNICSSCASKPASAFIE